MRSRLLILAGAAGLWLLLVAGRLVDLQVRRHDAYLEQARSQQNRVIQLTPPRGTIYDRRGTELAVSVEALSAAADPSKIDEPEVAAVALSRVLGLERGKLAADLASGRGFTWLRRKLEPEVAEEVEALGIDGVFLLPESKRYYPLRTLAAQVLGYVGTDNEGLAGLEYLYDPVVASEPEKRTVVRDARGILVQTGRQGAGRQGAGRRGPGHRGQDLHLTLDATLQHIVERELAAAVRSSRARRGTAVVLDPRSGAVLAMASVPTFDPNEFSRYPEETWRNRVVSDAYEPGSTFKMITLAAALEAGTVDPLEIFDCERGATYVHGVRIRDHKPFGLLTTRQIISKSSNVGAIKLGERAGARRLYRTIESFGFGRPTGIDLPSESSGIVRPLERWGPRSSAYISFGQEISVTALQLTSAFAAIANGGELLRPYVVEAVGRVGETPRRTRRSEMVRVPISPSSVTLIRSMLEDVVVEGTAKIARLDGWRAAGKTGTAQMVDPEIKAYSPTKHIASFVGFAPLRRPALACTVVLDEPWPLYHGGDVAAPVFREIARQSLLYLGVPPDYRPEADGRPPIRAAVADTSLATVPAVMSTRRPTAPKATEPAPGTLPDFAGLSAREALRRAGGLGIQPALIGNGFVVGQTPAPGTPRHEVGRLELRLSTEAL